jgi:hypothetical protein
MYRRGSGCNNIKQLGGALGKVYDTGGHKRTTVIDFDHYLTLVL